MKTFKALNKQTWALCHHDQAYCGNYCRNFFGSVSAICEVVLLLESECGENGSDASVSGADFV